MENACTNPTMVVVVVRDVVPLRDPTTPTRDKIVDWDRMMPKNKKYTTDDDTNGTVVDVDTLPLWLEMKDTKGNNFICVRAVVRCFFFRGNEPFDWIQTSKARWMMIRFVKKIFTTGG